MSDSHEEEEGAGEEGRRYNLRDRGNNRDAEARLPSDEEDETAQNDDLTTILRYLVRTGQVRLMSSRRPLGEAVYVGGPSVIDDDANDDDDDDDSDATFEDDDRIDHQPEVDPTPDVQELRSSDFMQVPDISFEIGMEGALVDRSRSYLSLVLTSLHPYTTRKSSTTPVAVRFPTSPLVAFRSLRCDASLETTSCQPTPCLPLTRLRIFISIPRDSRANRPSNPMLAPRIYKKQPLPVRNNSNSSRRVH